MEETGYRAANLAERQSVELDTEADKESRILQLQWSLVIAPWSG